MPDLQYTRVGWQNAPNTSTPLSAANLNNMENGIVAATNAINSLQRDAESMDNDLDSLGNRVGILENTLVVHPSHVGMVIMTTMLDTMEKVIAVYGGVTWIQHSGYLLRADTTGITANNPTADGGEATHTLTVEEMPSHRHDLIRQLQPPSYNYGCVQASGSISNSSYQGSGATQYTDYAGGGQAHNNMPPYKNVYVWERTA